MTVVAPWHKSLCPYCFNRFYIGDCEVVSSRTIDPNTNQPTVLKKAPIGAERALGRVWVAPLTGSKYVSELATRSCPHCHQLLPSRLEDMDNQIIALVGGPNTSKTHYITSLITVLERSANLSRIGCKVFRPVGVGTQARYNQWYETLFVRHEQISPTQRLSHGQVNPPLVYAMTFHKKAWWQPEKRVNLILFDAAGEQIINKADMVVFSQYIMNASAIIFLIDPMTMPNLIQYLPAHLRGVTNTASEAFRILKDIEDVYEMNQGLSIGAELKIPAAFAIAKSDLLKYLSSQLSQQSPVLRDADYSNGLNVADLQAVSNEVEELVRRLEGPALLNATEQFSNHAFFAVSATGGPPDSQTFKYAAVNPRRVADPLFWVLWKLGIIDV